MLIAVVSDAHGARQKMDMLIAALPRVDALCFLGDMDRDGEYLRYSLEEAQQRAAFYAVAGNNDPFSDLPQTMELQFGNVRTILTHGHLFGVKLGGSRLRAYAKTRDCGLALYGHTHTARDGVHEGVRLVNPGALLHGDWALVEIGETVEVRVQKL